MSDKWIRNNSLWGLQPVPVVGKGLWRLCDGIEVVLVVKQEAYGVL
jgi:hypothetical protein